MAVTIVIPKEIKKGEQRVAIVPAVIDKVLKLGATIKVEHNAGQGIYAADTVFNNVEIVDSPKDLYAAGDLILKIQPPSVSEIEAMKEGAILVSTLYPYTNPAILKQLCAKKISAFALEMIPRISRAQSMDVLSSQATVVGYKAVLLAADHAKFFLPMFTTAAGTIRPAKVLVVGAGVAGLQAIATAKRLGARVSAYDVREASKQEVESLGAAFVEVGVKATASGGYARELTEEEKQKQRADLSQHIAANDVIIATAGVPGKLAPKIIFKDMVEAMQPGAVIVDTVAEMGGNCELTKVGETVVHNGVNIIGGENMASSMAIHASEMFAKNILNFITPLFKEGDIFLDWEDEVLKGSVATHDGNIAQEALKKLVEE